MIEKVKALVVKYQDMILYVFFGALATLVNTASYYLCYNIIGISNVPSVIIAWLLAVVFAFFTNKLWVFKSKSFAPDVLKHEIPTFFGARLLTGLLDLGIMYLAVDVLHGNGTVWKLISNILVIILNYVASKLIIFKKKDESPKEE
jgi:putative flippase GtrA